MGTFTKGNVIVERYRGEGIKGSGHDIRRAKNVSAEGVRI